MSTTDTTPTQGGLPPGAGEPGNRRGQQDPDDIRRDQQRTEATNALSSASNILAETVKQLGGWVKDVKNESIDGIKNYFSSGTKTILGDVQKALTAEIHAFGYVGEKLTQATAGSYQMLKGAVASTKDIFSNIKQRRADSIAADEAMKQAALAKADGDLIIYNEELKRLKEQKKNEEHLAKVEKQLQKENEKFLKAKTDEQKAERLEKMRLLEEQRKQIQSLLPQEDKNTAEKEEPKGGEECNQCEASDKIAEKIEILTDEVDENAAEAARQAEATAERIRAENQERHEEDQENADERHSETMFAGIKNAIIASLPGWLTVVAVGGLLAAVGLLVYSRWPQMVGGFNALKEDVIGLRDKVTMAINDGIEKVMKWGSDLLDWAKNLLPSFVEWWKMNMPTQLGGYDSDVKAQKLAALADEEKKYKENQEKIAQETAALEKQKADKQKQTAEEARRLAAENQKTKDENEKEKDKRQTASNNTSTVIKGGDTTAITQAPSARKAMPASPTRNTTTTAYS